MNADTPETIHPAVAESVLFPVAQVWSGGHLHPTHLEDATVGSKATLGGRIRILSSWEIYSVIVMQDSGEVEVLILPIEVDAPKIPSKRALLIRWGDIGKKDPAATERSVRLTLVFVSPETTRSIDQVLRDGYFFKHLRLALKAGALGASLEIAERIIRRNPGNRSGCDLKVALSIAQELFGS